MSTQIVSSKKKLIRSLEENFRRFLTDTFGKFKELSNKTFNNLADQADSNRLQTLYLDALLYLRLSKSDIQNNTIEKLLDGFGTAGKLPRPQLEQRGDGRPKRQKLELLDNEDLEVMIALDNASSDARDMVKETLPLLEKRYQSLVGSPNALPLMPMSPDAILEAFSSSFTDRRMAMEVKLVLIKVFNQACFKSGYRELITQSDEMLKEGGILPELEFIPVRKNELPESKKYDGPRDTADKKTGNRSEKTSRIQGALLNKLASILGEESHRQVAQEKTISIDEGKVLSAIEFQLERLVDRLSESTLEPGQPTRMVERELLQVAGAEGGQLSQHDSSVFNLIGMTFSRLGEHVHVVPEARQVFSKCELPILKLALQKPIILEQENHPIKRLFNEMARYAIGLEQGDCEDNQVYQQMLAFAEKMLDRNFDEEDIPAMLAEFLAVIDRDRRKSSVYESRSLEEVAARERINLAHTRVEEECSARMTGESVPAIFKEFIEQCWSKVLYMAHLRYGEGSTLWLDALKVMDSIFECLDLGPAMVDPVLVKQMLKDIEAQLENISFDAEQRTRYLTALEFMLLGFQKTTDRAPLSDVENELIGQLKRVVISSLQAAIPGENINDAITQAESIDDSSYQALGRLKKGNWVEIQQNERVLKGRLAGIVGPTWKYVFVNNRGKTVAEKDRARLAIELMEGKVAVLDNSHLFDRALGDAIKEIKGRAVG